MTDAALLSCVHFGRDAEAALRIVREAADLMRTESILDRTACCMPRSSTPSRTPVDGVIRCHHVAAKTSPADRLALEDDLARKIIDVLVIKNRASGRPDA
jgi:hypothetical protein